MPIARITTTFWVPSNRPIPPQMAAIQNHRGGPVLVGGISIAESYSMFCYPGEQCSESTSFCSRRSGAPEGRGSIMPRMVIKKKNLVLAAVILLSSAVLLQSAPAGRFGPEYTSDDQMKLPENYRQWVYLTTGFDMSYSAGGMGMDHHMFDNVFVNPEAYSAFLQSGTWPDKTML